MSWLQALILGLIQGLTEYLPVSSSGHLAIGQALFGLDDGSSNLTFTVLLHVACSPVSRGAAIKASTTAPNTPSTSSSR